MTLVSHSLCAETSGVRLPMIFRLAKVTGFELENDKVFQGGDLGFEIVLRRAVRWACNVCSTNRPVDSLWMEVSLVIRTAGQALKDFIDDTTCCRPRAICL